MPAAWTVPELCRLCMCTVGTRVGATVGRGGKGGPELCRLSSAAIRSSLEVTTSRSAKRITCTPEWLRRHASPRRRARGRARGAVARTAAAGTCRLSYSTGLPFEPFGGRWKRTALRFLAARKLRTPAQTRKAASSRRSSAPASASQLSSAACSRGSSSSTVICRQSPPAFSIHRSAQCIAPILYLSNFALRRCGRGVSD